MGSSTTISSRPGVADAASILPLWMVRILSQLEIYKTSFSKYGTAYQRLTLQTNQGGFSHATVPVRRAI